MVLFIFGPETYLSLQRLNDLKEAFIKKFKASNYQIECLDGTEINLETFQRLLRSQGLFASRRLVIFKNLISTAKDESLLKELEKNLKKSWFTNQDVFIFWESTDLETLKKENPSKLNSRIKIWQKLEKITSSEKNLENYKPLTGKKLITFVVNEIKKEGGKISLPAVRLLISLTEGDLWQIASEIKKLVAYTSGGVITTKDIQKLVIGKFDPNVFRLTDALGNQNKKEALKYLEEQLAQFSAPEIINRLVWFFRILILVKSVQKEGKSILKLNKEFKIHPFVLEKASLKAKNFTLIRLKKIYHQLKNIDYKFKIGLAKPEILLSLFAFQF